MDEKELQDFQEQPTSVDDWGTTLIVIGALLFLSVLVGLLFTGLSDLRWGTTPFLVWYIAATVLGFACCIAGWVIKHRANTKADS